MFVDATRLASRHAHQIPAGKAELLRLVGRDDSSLRQDEASAALVEALDRSVDACLSGTGTTRQKRTEIQHRLGEVPLSTFAADGLRANLRRQYRLLFRRRDISSPDLEAIEVLADALRRIKEARWGDFDECAQVKVAFHGTINPSDLLPSAFSLVETNAVAAWLGRLSRSAAVVMPEFVRSYWDNLLNGCDAWPTPEWAPDAFIIDKAASIMSAAEMRRWVTAAGRSAVVGKRGSGSALVLETYTPSLSDRHGLVPSSWQASLQR